MGVVVIGQGSWGRRIAEAFEDVVTWKHGQEGFDLTGAEMVYVVVPSPYLRATLERFPIDRETPVVSCIKGLTTDGAFPTDVVREVWQSVDVSHLGGPCLTAEAILCPRHGGDQLEEASILKNVYAIGFNYLWAKEGLNVASMALTHYLDEMPPVREGIADLLATCYSPSSRNARVGRLLAQGKPLQLGGQVAEGIHTAKAIERHDLFRDRWELRNLTKLIRLRL